MAFRVFFHECLGLCCLKAASTSYSWTPHVSGSLVWCMTERGWLPASLPYLLKVNSCCCEMHRSFLISLTWWKVFYWVFHCQHVYLETSNVNKILCFYDGVSLDFPVTLYHLIKSWCAFVEELTEKAAQRITSLFTGSVLHLHYQLHLFLLCQTRVQPTSPIWTINYPCPWKKSLKVAIAPFLKL